jgi:hypothetical protein
MTQAQHQLLIVVSAILFIGMIIMNVLANTLPLGGQTTGGVSDRYPNLFQPSGMTFSIWGIIYLLLGAFVVVQMFSLGQPFEHRQDAMGFVLLFFGLSSIFNVAWLFAWHHHKILLSTLLIIMLLVVLLFATHYSQSLGLLTKASFSIYAGWVTVATIANITILLVSYGLPSFSSLAIVLTIIILIVGACIGGWYAYQTNNMFYVGVLIWAYLGILMRHLNQESLSVSYPAIILSTSILLVGFIALEIILFFRSLH